MKKHEDSSPESQKKGKGWKVMRNINPVRKPLLSRKKKKGTEA